MSGMGMDHVDRTGTTSVSHSCVWDGDGDGGIM